MSRASAMTSPSATGPPPGPEADAILLVEAEVDVAGRDGYGAAHYNEIDEADIIRSYAPMVKSLAAHLKGRVPESVLLEDLIQAGMIAVLRLMRVGNLDQRAEGPLRRSIMNAMIDEARHETWAPVRTIRRAKAAAAAMRAVEQRLGRHGNDEELAAEMQLTLAQYHELLMEVAGIRLLDVEQLVEAEGGLAAGDDNPEMALHKDRIVAALTDAIAALPERERMVVSLYYDNALNMDEVGAVLGFDKSTVCRAHGRALLMLRAALQGWK